MNGFLQWSVMFVLQCDIFMFVAIMLGTTYYSNILMKGVVFSAKYPYNIKLNNSYSF